MSERIWFKDIQGFMTEYNYTKFFPSKEMTFAEQLNSILRFSIYLSVLIFVLRQNLNIFLIVVFVGLFTYLLFSVDTKNKDRERFYLKKENLSADKHTKKLCVKPTKDNPFMNLLINEYSENPKRKQACDVSSSLVKKTVKKMFNSNLYRDVSDIYNKNSSDRNYYTMPSTTIPNDQNAFAQYLYGKNKTCKEGDGNQCYKNTYRSISS